MRNVIVIVCCLLLVACSVPLKKIDGGWTTNMRGLHAVDDQTAWASGTQTVILRLSYAKYWSGRHGTPIEAFHGLDFRDIHGFNENEAVIMSSGDGCEMYRTENAGMTWELVYENHNEGIFFDGMDFWDDKRGIAFSDPIDGQLFLIRTTDGGNTWEEMIPDELPKVEGTEAGFAASGTGIVCKGDSTVWIATGGGEKARVFKSRDAGMHWNVFETPITTDPSKYRGIYSMAMRDEMNGIVIGGSFTDSAATDGICAYTKDGGKEWNLSESMPSGYRSCVTYLEKDTYICCGRNGIDVTKDGGIHWTNVSNEGYYSVIKVGETIWFTGKKGRMARLSMKYIRRLTPH